MSAAPVLTDEQFASQALWKAGVTGGIATFTGGDLEEKVAAAYWPLTAAALTMTTWRFNTVTAQLSRLTSAPPTRWDYRFSLPSDRLDQPGSVYESAELIHGHQNFELFEDELWCDDETAFVVYQRRPSSPAKWSPLFRDFVLTDLAGELALSINQDRSRYETLKIEAYGSLDVSRLGGKLSLALQREGATTAPEIILPNGGPLVQAHHGGG